MKECFAPQIQRILDVLVSLHIVCETSAGYRLTSTVPLADSPPYTGIEVSEYWKTILVPALRSGNTSVQKMIEECTFDHTAFKDATFSKDESYFKQRLSSLRTMSFGSNYRNVYHNEDDRLLQHVEEVPVAKPTPVVNSSHSPHCLIACRKDAERGRIMIFYGIAGRSDLQI